MRILIDATSLLLRSAGIKSYTWHWLRALRGVAPPRTVGAFPFLDANSALDHERSVVGPLATYTRLAALYGVNLGGSVVLDWITRGADVFHASNQVRVAPWNCRLTATIHDMTCWLMPQMHTAANVRADASFAQHIVRRATRLIAVSENTRRDAVRLLGVAPERIEVIYSGVDERFFSAAPARRDRPYVLYLGTIEPRKNVDTLLDAWTAVPAGLRDQYDLLVAGPLGWSSGRTLARLQSGMPGVRYLGYVPEREIPSLTAGATLFAYVSLYEGFGFPVAQAMAAGVPVLTSGTSCLPEITAGGAVIVDPQSPAEIAKALAGMLEDPELRTRLGAAGRKRATELYRWEECARRSLAFFERAACS
jgi:glycosyltransferase involved in cell wall biosynthesis